jgi:hypothetical protein
MMSRLDGSLNAAGLERCWGVGSQDFDRATTLSSTVRVN